jgi:hypothetical protein
MIHHLGSPCTAPLNTATVFFSDHSLISHFQENASILDKLTFPSNHKDTNPIPDKLQAHVPSTKLKRGKLLDLSILRRALSD